MRLLRLLLLLLAVCCPASFAAAAVLTYQAENAARSNAAVATTLAGYTGSGYVDFADAVGSYVEFTVTVGSSGRARVTFVHADSTPINRPVEVRLNGKVVASAANLSFGRTATSGANWQQRSIWVVLSAGANKIRLTALSAAGGPNIDRVEVDDAYAPAIGDWSKVVATSIMTRFPTAASYGPWEYTRTILMQGLLEVAVRTGNSALLAYVKAWVDSRLNGNSTVNAPFDDLDDFQGGTLLLRLYDATGLAKYKAAADSMFGRFATYPTTSDGAWLHRAGMPGQLWLDGTFMAVPFALEYGERFETPASAYQRAASEMLTYAGHLADPATGLLFHAHDELGTSNWLGAGGTRSTAFWCRSLGWYGMAMVETLARLPVGHAQREALVGIFLSLADGIVRFQDPASGLWLQVVDRDTDADNWTETSCSAMFAFILARGIDLGLLEERVMPVANRAFQGVLQRVWQGPDRLTRVEEVVIGTSPGSVAQYLTRPRTANDLHGLGAFLRMYERLGTLPANRTAIWLEAESGTRSDPLAKRFSPSATGRYYLQAQGAPASTDAAPGNGIVRYRVTLPRTTDYRIWARVNAPDSELPGFWVRIDGGAWMPWKVGNASMLWYWDMVRDPLDPALPAAFELDAGQHVIEIAYAQPLARLDRILVTDAVRFHPGNGGL